MYQAPTLTETLASIGIDVEATETRLTIRAINDDLLREWCIWQAQQESLEAWLEAERLRWYGSKEAELADFCRWMRQADAEWEAVEAEEEDDFDWQGGWYE
jgi:hypothetical protein